MALTNAYAKRRVILAGATNQCVDIMALKILALFKDTPLKYLRRPQLLCLYANHLDLEEDVPIELRKSIRKF